MAVDFFLQNTHEYETHFDEQWEVDEWTIEDNATVTLDTSDSDYPQAMKVVEDTDGKGVYITLTGCQSSASYICEFVYKNQGSQEIDVVVYDSTNGANIETDTLKKTSWRLFYQEFTTPSTCTSVSLYLRAGTACGLAFYVTDVKIQGNAISFNPEIYTPRYPDVQNTHTVINGQEKTDKVATKFGAQLQWPYLTDPQFARLRQVFETPATTYFDDAAVPAMVETGQVWTETTYNYDGITNPSSTHVAWSDSSASIPTDATDFQTTEFTGADYGKVDEDDSNYVEDTASSTGHYAYHAFKFKVTEYTADSDVRSIHVTYKGSCSDASQSGNNGIRLLVWNGNTWMSIGQTRTSDKETFTFSLNVAEQAQDFVDVTNDYILIIAMSQAMKKTDGAVTLRSYFLQVIVNKELDSEIALSSPAKLVSGDISSVQNITQMADLTLAGWNDGVSMKCLATYYAQAANNTILDFTTEDIFCVSAWLKVDSNLVAPNRSVLTKYEVTKGYQFTILGTSGLAYLVITYSDGTSSTITGTTDLRDDAWHHVAAVWDRNTQGNCKIYVDGSDDTAATGGALKVLSCTNSGLLNIGRVLGAYNIAACIADVKIHYGAAGLWSDAQVLAQYNNPYNYDESTVGSLLDYWPIDEGTGTTLSGNTNDLTLSSASAWMTEGPKDLGVSLACASTYYATGASALLDLTTSSICISAWVKLSSAIAANHNIIVNKRVSGSGGGYVLFFAHTVWYYALTVYYSDDSFHQVYGTTDLRDDTWHHIAAVWDRDTPGSCKIYVDGADDTGGVSGAQASLSSTNASPFYIGRDASTNRLNGDISDVKVFIGPDSDCWTVAQVLYQYNNPHHYDRDNVGQLTEAFPLLEATGTTLNGQRNTLTLSSASAWQDISPAAFGYRIGTDRQSVETTGQFTEDMIRVTYDHRMPCRITDLSETRRNTVTPTSPPRQVSLSIQAMIGLRE